MEDNLRRALEMWRDRQAGRDTPHGMHEATARPPKWHIPDKVVIRFVPASYERQSCCKARSAYAEPSELFTQGVALEHPDYKHCLTLTHVANLYGVSRMELMRALRSDLARIETTNKEIETSDRI